MRQILKRLSKKLGPIPSSTLVMGLLFSFMVQAAPLRVGFVYIGPTGDAGYTYAHDLGRRYLERQLGDQVKTTYVENVAEGADSERVIRQLARTGHKLIFTTSFGYMDATAQVAQEFPDVRFEHMAGYKRADNIGTYMGRMYQARYLTGVLAGHMSKTGQIGYVASFPIPQVIRGINAFTQGVRRVNPQAEVKVLWVNAWYDPARELEAAQSLIIQGADVISQHTDSAGPTQAAQALGAYAIGYNADMSAFGEQAHLSAAMFNWGPLYTRKAQAVLDNRWRSEDVWAGLGEDIVGLAPLNSDVPQAVQDEIETLRKQLVAGLIHPFEGPLTSREGEPKLAQGERADDKAMLDMRYFVPGVVGELPQLPDDNTAIYR